MEKSIVDVLIVGGGPACSLFWMMVMKEIL